MTQADQLSRRERQPSNKFTHVVRIAEATHHSAGTVTSLVDINDD